MALETTLARRRFLQRTAALAGGALLGAASFGCAAVNDTTTPSAPSYPALFPQSFLWGVATSAYQIEGAVHEDGRGESIWDRFSHTPGKTKNGATGDVADDHYHRYNDDLDLMHSLGIQSYRFSVAWPHILPDGAGPVNQKGLDFYRRLVDGLLQRAIRPMATLFHWDLPQALQDQGGWENRDTAMRFADYADTVFQALGDAVPSWLTLNEPKTVVTVGYIYGGHAPGYRDPARAYVALHHMLLGHGLAARAFQARFTPSSGRRIGIALNLSPVYPADSVPGTQDAVRLQDGFENRLYLDPILRGSYPSDVTAALGDSWPSAAIIQSGDLGIIKTPIDLLGINYYNPTTVTAGPRVVGGALPTSAATWEQVYPEGLYDLLVRLKQDYGDLPLSVTENGAAYDDTLDASSRVDDPQRQQYLRDHLLAAHRALQAGVSLYSYHAWSLLDNFEWAEGYTQRWGIVYVDYATQRRYPKQSALWYRDVISHNGIIHP
jgi:beta-glucosidase